ncbi:DnaJ domain-containing protein, partial [Cynara cardunculus var. scolymus]
FTALPLPPSSVPALAATTKIGPRSSSLSALLLSPSSLKSFLPGLLEKIISVENVNCFDHYSAFMLVIRLYPRILKNLIMQLANNALRQTHYDVLGVKEDASQEEVRTSYRSALLCSHPDKLHKISSDHNDPRVRFLEIQTAWEILGDVSRQDEVTADEVELEDLMVDASGDVVELFYQCRCGDYFSLDSSELREMGFQLLTEERPPHKVAKTVQLDFSDDS